MWKACMGFSNAVSHLDDVIPYLDELGSVPLLLYVFWWFSARPPWLLHWSYRSLAVRHQYDITLNPPDDITSLLRVI